MDVGCNTGLYSEMLHAFGVRKVLGFDLDEERIERDSGTVRPEPGFEVANAETVGLPGGYDAVPRIKVIEHTEDSTQVRANIH